MAPFCTRKKGQEDDCVEYRTFSYLAINTEGSGRNIKSLLLKKYDTV